MCARKSATPVSRARSSSPLPPLARARRSRPPIPWRLEQPHQANPPRALPISPCHLPPPTHLPSPLPSSGSRRLRSTPHHKTEPHPQRGFGIHIPALRHHQGRAADKRGAGGDRGAVRPHSGVRDPCCRPCCSARRAMPTPGGGRPTSAPASPSGSTPPSMVRDRIPSPRAAEFMGLQLWL